MEVEAIINNNLTSPVVRELMLDVIGAAVRRHTALVRVHLRETWNRVRPPWKPIEVSLPFLRGLNFMQMFTGIPPAIHDRESRLGRTSAVCRNNSLPMLVDPVVSPLRPMSYYPRPSPKR